MSKRVDQYKDAMRRYHDGEFGDNSLSLHQILTLADAPDNLLEEMTVEELEELISGSQSVQFKLAISQMISKKRDK